MIMFDEKYFQRVLKEIKNDGLNQSKRLLDSLSPIQFESKSKLLEMVDEYIEKYSTVTVMGCWFMSIVGYVLSQKVKYVQGIDFDDRATRMGRRLFDGIDNVEFVNKDVFKMPTEKMILSNLIINTSCEHMPPMKEYPYWDRMSKDTYFAFQTHTNDNINDHTNCVTSLTQFKEQIPDTWEILKQDVLEDKDRGAHRYTLVGKIK